MKKRMVFTVLNGTEKICLKRIFCSYLDFNYFPQAMKVLPAEVIKIEFERFCEKFLNLLDHHKINGKPEAEDLGINKFQL